MKKFLSLFALFLAATVAFPQGKSKNILTVAEMAGLSPSAGRTLTLSMPDGSESALTWSERNSSLNKAEGIRTFVGYSDSGMAGVLSLRGQRISGWLLHQGRTWRITTAADGQFSLMPEEAAKPCGGCDSPPVPADGPSAAHGLPSDWSNAEEDSVVYNDGVLHVYRLAIPVDYYYFSNEFKTIEAVKEFWARTESGLNEIYTRDMGIYFQVVNDERLIVSDSNTPFHTSTNGSQIIEWNTIYVDKMIGSDTYDIGIVVAHITSGQSGIAYRGGGFLQTYKAGAAAISSLSTIGHELGHMFGSKHTHTLGGNSSDHTEPGTGKSLMSYGHPRDFFVFHNTYVTRQAIIDYQPYYKYPDRDELVNPEKKNSGRGYNNFSCGIPTGNRAPVIDTTQVQRKYKIPKNTYFEFHIPATDPDGDALSYFAHQTDPCTQESQSKAAFLSNKATSSPTVRFQPTWSYSWSQSKFSQDDYSEPTATGTFHFMLGVHDGRSPEADFLNAPHATCYDAYETQLEIVEGKPFRFSSYFTYQYDAGQRLTLKWDVDTSVFPEDSRVRILLSDDFGETFKYVLKESAPNNGACEVILPQASFSAAPYKDTGKYVRPGVIKIEVIGNVAYALSAVSPIYDNGEYQDMAGGFRLTASSIVFSGTPERYVTVTEEKIPPVADVTATYNGTALEVTFSETRDGNVISRVWEAETALGKKSAFEQIIVIKESEPPFVPVESISLEPQELELLVGETQAITATVVPADATDPTLRWESDNTQVCTVGNDGTVTATGPGSAYVKATSADGAISASCLVSVTIETGVSGTSQANSWNVKAQSGNLQIENAAGMPAEIFNLQGVCLYNRLCASSPEDFAVETGIYLVRIGNTVRKIAVP